jgi:hypothetical protein
LFARRAWQISPVFCFLEKRPRCKPTNGD